MKQIIKTLSIALLLAVMNTVVQAAVGVAPFQIEESRRVAFADDKVSRTPPSLKVVLSLIGPEAESSVRYGNLKLEQAVDDLGASLIPPKDSFHEAAKFKDYSNAFFRKSGLGHQGHPTAPQVEVSLSSPKRSATKIARLRGTLSLAEQGTMQTIELASLKGAGKKTMAVPEGAHLGITATVASEEGARSISIEISGDENALESIEVVDASGRKVSSGLSSWAFSGGPEHRTMNLDKPLDNSMKLIAKVALNRKITQVAFDLRDIALP